MFMFCRPLWAQSYLPATIIFHSGQKETGLTYHGNWIETPQSFRFKNVAGQERKYGCDELKSVELRRKDGKTEHYECRVVQVNRSTTKLVNLEIGPSPRLEIDTVFMQTLLRSEINLYVLQQDDQSHFFVEKDSLQPLVFKQYIRAPNDPALLQNNRYRQQLLALTQDCPYLKEFILKIPYSGNRIRRILLEYNKCRESPITYEFKPEKIKFHAHAGIGVAITTLRNARTTEYYEPFRVLENDPVAQVTPVVGILFPIPRTNNRIGIRSDLSMRRLRYSYEATPPGVPTSMEKIHLTHIRSQTFLQWNLINRRQKLFLLAGIHYSWVFVNQSELTLSSLFEKTQRDYDFNFVSGLGYEFQRIGLDIRYDRGNGYVPNGAITSSIHTFSVFVHYRIF